MKARIQKWGNSLAVRIPKSFAHETGLGNDSPVEMTLENGSLVVRPDKEQIWDLDALLAKVTAENLHPEWEAEAQEDGPGVNDR